MFQLTFPTSQCYRRSAQQKERCKKSNDNNLQGATDLRSSPQLRIAQLVWLAGEAGHNQRACTPYGVCRSLSTSHSSTRGLDPALGTVEVVTIHRLYKLFESDVWDHDEKVHQKIGKAKHVPNCTQKIKVPLAPGGRSSGRRRMRHSNTTASDTMLKLIIRQDMNLNIVYLGM